jgi:uncharacterized membrane protein (UPF0127 family)
VKHFQKNIFIAAGIALALVILGTLFIPKNTVRVTAPNGNVQAIVADTAEKRQLGLSNRPSLRQDQAMLFVFEDNQRHGIWMKDMKFAIDIVWIDEDKIVVDIAENVQPSTYPKTFLPASPARYVLEMVANQAQAKGFSRGTQLSFPSMID